jgi:hypothetical protein
VAGLTRFPAIETISPAMARKHSRRSASPGRNTAPAASVCKWKFAVEVTELEIAAGHDGFCRGKPDPALLIGAFFVTTFARPTSSWGPASSSWRRIDPRTRFGSGSWRKMLTTTGRRLWS